MADEVTTPFLLAYESGGIDQKKEETQENRFGEDDEFSLDPLS